MKIGILTFHRALNYGAFLQAFALKNHLENLGHEVEIIDYWPQYHQNAYKDFNRSETIHFSLKITIKKLIAGILRYWRWKKRKAKMEKLQEQYFHLTHHIKYPTAKDLTKISLDCVIYGSDQIWWKSKLNKNHFDWVFFGDYIPSTVKKIAYAASMGVINFSDSEKKQLKEKFQNFYRLSVRENNLKNEIKNITTQNVDIVLDPVFLMNKDFWEKQIVNSPKNDKYILLFNLTRTPETTAVAKQKSNELKLPIIEISSTILPLNFKKNCLQTLDAFEFLAYIKNSEFVVTSSFHCTAFSIIFEKQFIATGMGNNAERVKTLLRSIKLQNHYVSNLEEIPLGDIDYPHIAPVLKNEVNKSIAFIEGCSL